MVNDLWQRAQQLASRRYSTNVAIDTLTNGEKVYVVENPELDGCMAHGETEDKALENLLEARTEYIYSLLEDGLPVPAPEGESLRTSTGTKTAVWVFIADPQRAIKELVEPVIEPTSREKKLSVIPRGDFVQQT